MNLLFEPYRVPDTGLLLVSIPKRISGSRNKIMVRISTSCNRVRINPDPDSHKKSRCFPLNETLPESSWFRGRPPGRTNLIQLLIKKLNLFFLIIFVDF